MHDDDVTGKKHDEHAQTVPEDPEIHEPKDPNIAIHESMHAKGESTNHDSDVKKPSEDIHGPLDREEMMHKLMHDDGDIHKHAWDAKNPDEEKISSDGIQGPPDREEMMHKLMHDGDDIHKHAWDAKKPGEGERPLEDIHSQPDREEMMHKLMHDGGDIHKHAWDAEKPGGVQSPPDREHLMHNLMMHGDLKHGEKHETQDNDKGEKPEAFPSPPTNKEHHDTPKVDGDVEKSDSLKFSQTHKKHVDKAEEGMPSPPNEEQLMHGLLMHGNLEHGDHHDQHESTKENKEKVGPLDAEEQLHGVLMHNDKEPGHHHDHESDKTEQPHGGPKGPDYDSLHGILMHGDKELGHDHSAEDKNAAHDVFSDLSKIMELELDEDILKIGNLQELLKKDKAEYAEYLATNPKPEDAASMGSTFATVSDNILSDIEIMKQRYLSKLGDDLEALEMEAAVVDKRYKEDKFVADDVNSELDSRTHVHEHEDRAIHEMELIGSTEPINARHKMFNVLQENKEKEKRETGGNK